MVHTGQLPSGKIALPLATARAIVLWRNSALIAETSRCSNCNGKQLMSCPTRNQFVEMWKRPFEHKQVKSPKARNQPTELSPVGVYEGLRMYTACASAGTLQNRYSAEELIRILLEMSDMLNCCTTRADQIKTLGLLVIKYG